MSDTFSADCHFCGIASDCFLDKNGKMECHECYEAAGWYYGQAPTWKEGLFKDNKNTIIETVIGLLSLYKEK